MVLQIVKWIHIVTMKSLSSLNFLITVRGKLKHFHLNVSNSELKLTRYLAYSFKLRLLFEFSMGFDNVASKPHH